MIIKPTTIKIARTTHERLHFYRIHNQLRNLDMAIIKLLDEAKFEPKILDPEELIVLLEHKKAYDEAEFVRHNLKLRNEYFVK